MYKIERAESIIDDVLNTCMESEELGQSQYPAMTYEQGIAEAIRWITDNGHSDLFD